MFGCEMWIADELARRGGGAYAGEGVDGEVRFDGDEGTEADEKESIPMDICVWSRRWIRITRKTSRLTVHRIKDTHAQWLHASNTTHERSCYWA